MKKLGLAAGGVVLALVVMELLLRLTGFGVTTPELAFGVNTRQAFQHGQFVPDARLFWKLPPQRDALDAAIGAIQPDRAIPPHRSVPRIVILGDSCSRLAVEGLPYPAGLQRRLGGQAEVLTAAVPGYTSYQGLVWLREQILAARPDLVVVYFGWNDHWRATGLTDREYADRLAGGHLRLLTLLQGKPDTPPLRVPTPHYDDNLEAIATAVQEQGGQVLLVRAPQHLTPEARGHLLQNRYILASDDPVELHRDYLAVLDRAAAAADVPTLDAAAAFVRLRPDATLLHRDGIHLTTAGHTVMAAILAEWIRGQVLEEPGHGRPAEIVGREALAESAGR